ncbi:MAG: DegV family protein [Bacillota bacterium]
MKKTAVIAVSTGCLDYLDIPYDNLFIVRCKILINNQTYNDYIDITAERFYDMLNHDKSLMPSSSMPSLGEITETFDRILEAGYENVLFITISSALSGTYQTALMAKNAYNKPLNIQIINTKNAAISEGFISLEALRMIDEGKNIDVIKETLETLSISRKQYFMVDNLRLLVKNGRLSNASGFLGSLLKIKPILEVNDEGKIVPFEKVRTQKKALERMVDYVIDDLKSINNFVITYDTSDNEAGFDYVKSRIDAAYPNNRFYAAPITPVIGCHTGVGTVGIAYFNLDNIDL